MSSSWIAIDPLHESPPPGPGVYVISMDGIAVYVGQSIQMQSRFAGHDFRYGYGRMIHTPWATVPDFIKVACKYKPTQRWGDWVMQELRLIRRLKPPFNNRFKAAWGTQ